MLLSSVSSREMKSTGAIRSKCAKPGMPIPTSYSDLSIRMNGEVGSTENLDYHNMMYYYWIIIVWINGPYICIVIIYYLLVNEIGFAHPKIIDAEELKTLKLSNASSKFTIINKMGEIRDPLQTCYYGYTRFILKLIQDLLASEDGLSNNSNMKPIDVLILLINNVMKGSSKKHKFVEVDYLEAVLKLRRLQLATSLGGKDAKNFLIVMIDKVLGYHVRRLSLETYPCDGVSAGKLLHSASKAFETKVNELLAYSEIDMKEDENAISYLPGAIRRELEQVVCHIDFETQLNWRTDETSRTGCYVDESGELINYICTDIETGRNRYHDQIRSRPPPELREGQSAIAVFMNSVNDTSLVGYIYYHVVSKKSDVVDTTINLQTLSKVCKLDESLCEFCTNEMGTVLYKNACCHVDLAATTKRSKCICVPEVLVDEIRNHNAKHDDNLITVKEKHVGKRKSDTRDSMSSSTAIADNIYCVCRTDYDGSSSSYYNDDMDMIWCSGDSCEFNGWCHFKCLGLDHKEYEGDKQFFCPSCSRKNAIAQRKTAKTSESEDSLAIGETAKSSESEKYSAKMEEE